MLKWRARTKFPNRQSWNFRKTLKSVTNLLSRTGNLLFSNKFAEMDNLLESAVPMAENRIRHSLKDFIESSAGLDEMISAFLHFIDRWRSGGCYKIFK
jgi:hypothetical protein